MIVATGNFCYIAPVLAYLLLISLAIATLYMLTRRYVLKKKPSRLYQLVLYDVALLTFGLLIAHYLICGVTLLVAYVALAAIVLLLAADLVMRLETKMANAHMLKEDVRDPIRTYNRIPLEELGGIMPSFNWEGFLKEAGVAEIDVLVVSMIDHMRALDLIIAETSLEDWKIWLKWTVLNSTAGWLNEEEGISGVAAKPTGYRR